MDLILFAGIFIAALALTQALLMLIRSRFNPEVVRLKREIGALAASGYNGSAGVDIVRKKTLSEIPWLNAVLMNLGTPTIGGLERLRQQADARQPLGFFILLSVVAAVGVFWLVLLVSRGSLAAFVAAAPAQGVRRKSGVSAYNPASQPRPRIKSANGVFALRHSMKVS